MDGQGRMLCPPRKVLRAAATPEKPALLFPAWHRTQQGRAQLLRGDSRIPSYCFPFRLRGYFGFPRQKPACSGNAAPELASLPSAPCLSAPVSATERRGQPRGRHTKPVQGLGASPASPEGAACSLLLARAAIPLPSPAPRARCQSRRAFVCAKPGELNARGYEDENSNQKCALKRLAASRAVKWYP